MVVPQDDNHSSGSSTCLPDDAYQQSQVDESQEYEADFSTIPSTPNVRSFLADVNGEVQLPVYPWAASSFR